MLCSVLCRASQEELPLHTLWGPQGAEPSPRLHPGCSPCSAPRAMLLVMWAPLLAHLCLGRFPWNLMFTNKQHKGKGKQTNKTHTHAPTHARTHMHTHTRTHTHVCAHTHAHTRTGTQMKPKKPKTEKRKQANKTFNHQTEARETPGKVKCYVASKSTTLLSTGIWHCWRFRLDYFQ